MRTVIQRVKSAHVEINGIITSSISHGLLVLAGFEDTDTLEDLQWMAKKIVQLRIFNDAHRIMNLNIQDVRGNLLIVSQFTLLASTKKGNRPSYIRAAKPAVAIPLYEAFIEIVQQEAGKPVFTGKFGADMQVALVNDGPVTIIIDSKQRE
ncbi:MAG: D-aminoacyl-tRNA deacylase [Chitinophagales bacterium]|nr:MAG: D-aminoacyl-tRNA deacylase [Chitinophagales bacterium]